MGVQDPAAFDLITRPDALSVQCSLTLLTHLGFLDDGGTITDEGR
jgi:HrpA-like RNA helicase